jgi:enediyne biosynthesis thioesterase
MPEAYLYRHRVTFDETNLVGNVYFAHFVHWQGHCRELFLADHAPGVLGALANGLALVTVDCAVEFFGEGRAFDDIELRMSLERLRGNRITMCFDYVRTGPPPAELLAHGRQTVACMRRGGAALEPSAIPDELRRALAGYAPAGVPA